MIGFTAKTKFLSLFVMAFVCLNAVGAACVAYCRVADAPMAVAAARTTPHHCGMADGSQAETGGSVLEIAGDFEPCPMALTFVGAPVEKNPARISEAAPASDLNLGDLRDDLIVFGTFPGSSSYRGPPLLDRRVDRIKHRVLLI